MIMMEELDPNGYDKAFGNEVELEDIDINEIVDYYVKMGPPDETYMLETRLKWEVPKCL